MPPKCGSNPPSARSGGSSSGSSVPCPNCCGCVTGAVIQNVQFFTTPPITRGGATVANGHSFDFVISMSFTAGTGGTVDCTFEWWEKVDVPAIAGHSANTWTDMFAFVPTSPTFDPWNNRVVSCAAVG